MRSRKRHLLLAAVLGAVAVMLPAVASSVTTPIEAVNESGLYGETHRWSPSQETVIAGAVVTFRNSTEVPHGVHWVTVPTNPVCSSGVPIGTTAAASGTKWSGTCTFTQAGTYTFYCTVHGAEMSGTITVTNGEPSVTTEAATPVTEHEATLKGTVNPNGKATEYFFKWGTTASYGQETSMQPAGEGTTGVAVSAMLKGLTPGTSYHFRLVAKNEKGTTEGADETFTTTSPPPPPGPPTATTEGATAISETGATLKGMVNPDGEATKYFFKWGTTEGYGQMTSSQPAGGDHLDHAVSASLTGLAPGTTYHFRLFAENKSGEVSGADQMFATASPSEPPPSTTTTTLTTPPPATTPVVTPPPPKTEEVLAPVVGGSLKLTAPRHGSSVRGSLDVSQSGAGGRLEVDLLAKSASVARRGHSKQVTVGRFVRKSVSAGKASFSVALNGRGKSALRRHRRLALTVKITLTPTRGAAVTIMRSVVLHA